MKNRKVDMVGLLKMILSKWPVLIVVALVFGIFGCGKYYLNFRKSSQTADQNEATSSDSSVINYNDQQVQLINKEILYLNQYIADTPANEINPYKAGYASAVLSIENDGKNIVVNSTESSTANSLDTIQELAVTNDPKINLIAAYTESFLKTGVDWSGLKDKYNVADESFFYDFLDVKINGNVASVDFWFKDKDSAQDILNEVLDQLNGAFLEFQNDNGLSSYSLKTTAVSSTTRAVSRDKTQWLYNKITDLKNLASSIENSNAVSTASNTRTSAVVSFSRKDMLKSGIKYGIFGFVLAAFAVAVILLYRHYVLSEDELDENMGIFSLGKLEVSKDFSAESVIAEVSKNHDLKKTVFITDTADKNSDCIINMLSENGISEIKVLDHLLKDKSQRDSLAHYDTAVLMIKVGESKYTLISDILQVLKSRGVKIAGTVSI